MIKQLLFGFVGGFFFSIPTIVDYLWPLWDDQNRALHDMLRQDHVVSADASGRRGTEPLGAPVQIISSRPGPTPIITIGIPRKSEM